MPGKISTSVTMEGEKEYRAALREIDSGLRVLKSEMSKVTAEFSGNEDGVEALTAKSDVLSRTISTQEDKINQLREATAKAAQTYGEADTRTQSWQVKLNNAEAELARLNNRLRENAEAIDEAIDAQSDLNDDTNDASSSFKGLGDAVNDAAGKLGVSLPGGATNALNSLGNVNLKAAAAAAGLAALAAAIAKVEQKLADMTREAAAAADEILTMSSVSGLDTTMVQTLQYASELMDVSVDQMSDGLKEITNKMQEARDGSEDTAAKFQQLGVSITDSSGELRSAQDVMLDVIDGLHSMSNTTERDALAMDLLSESARNFNPLIESGSDVLREYAEEAENAGYIMDSTTLVTLQKVDDSYQRLQKSIEGARNKIAVQFAPSLENVYGKLKDFIEKIGTGLAESGIVESFGSILESVGGLLEPLGDLIDAALPALTPLLEDVAKVVALIADTLKVIVGVLTLNIDLIKEGLGLSMGSGKLNAQQSIRYKDSGSVWDPNLGAWVGSGAGANAGGTQYWRGGYSYVGENGPELVYLPRGSEVRTAQESRDGGDVFNITISAASVKEFNDIVEIARNARMMARKAVVV